MLIQELKTIQIISPFFFFLLFKIGDIMIKTCWNEIDDPPLGDTGYIL